MNKALKLIAWTTAAIFAAALVTGAAVWWRYRQEVKADRPAQCLKVSLTPTDKVRLGETIALKLEFSAPWDKKPETVELVPGKGSQVSGAPAFTRTKWGWGESRWEAVCPLQTYSLGDIPTGKAEIRFLPGENAAKGQTLEATIPAFKSEPIPNAGSQLSIASKVTPESLKAQSKRWAWVIIAAAVVSLLAFGFWFLTRRQAAREVARRLPYWTVALNDLSALGDGFRDGRISGLECVTRLCDIARNYLERRFTIHAPRQTTPEFLRTLDSPAGPLTNQDRNFLREFMIAADMVKFARVDAPREHIQQAVERAGTLVRETAPQTVEETKS